MTELTPELYFRNLPEIEALPFDLCVDIIAHEGTTNIAPFGSSIAPHHRASIQTAMAKTSKLFGVSLQVWKEPQRRTG